MGEWTAPFAGYRSDVREEWLDYNGHLHDAFYAVVFSDANEDLFAALDLSEAYRAAEGKAYYTVETHLRFVAECSRGDLLSAETTLVDADAKRIRLYTELFATGAGTTSESSEATGAARLVATAESLYLHVDTEIGRTAPLSDDRRARLDSLLAAHAALPRPPHLGLGVGAPRPDRRA
jgi:acyl-CoA thioester hydrolase